MAYGLRTRMPSRTGHLRTACELPSTAGWQTLSEACRLELVERALGRAGCLPRVSRRPCNHWVRERMVTMIDDIFDAITRPVEHS